MSALEDVLEMALIKIQTTGHLQKPSSEHLKDRHNYKERFPGQLIREGTPQG